MIPAMRPMAEVLLVDDNPADVDLTKQIMGRKNRHLRFTALSDGMQAMQFLRRCGQYGDVPRPDVIVLDLGLPGIDGRRVLQELNTDLELMNIPIIVFTASDATEDVVRSYKSGASCYFRKPGNLPDFIAVVQSMADFWIRFATHSQKKAETSEQSPKAVLLREGVRPMEAGT